MEPKRRNYTAVFEALRAHPKLVQDANFRLNLVGNGNLSIPQDLTNTVVKHQGLPFRVRCR